MRKREEMREEDGQRERQTEGGRENMVTRSLMHLRLHVFFMNCVFQASSLYIFCLSNDFMVTHFLYVKISTSQYI